MIVDGKNKPEPLDSDALEDVSGGLIITSTNPGSPVAIPDTVIDDRTLAVIGRAISTQDAVDLARSLGVSTERISWVEYEQMRSRADAKE